MLGPPPTKDEEAQAYAERYPGWAKKNPDMARHLTPSGQYPSRVLSPHQFNVHWAHSKDSIKEGRLEEGVSNVTILGANTLAGNMRAKMVAEQMVAARGKEPTRTEWVP